MGRRSRRSHRMVIVVIASMRPQEGRGVRRFCGQGRVKEEKRGRAAVNRREGCERLAADEMRGERGEPRLSPRMRPQDGREDRLAWWMWQRRTDADDAVADVYA